MSRTNPEARPEAEDCIRMLRFIAKKVKADKKTINRCIRVYKKLYPDWEKEEDREHYFFYSVSFILDAIDDYSNWLKITADDWEDKLNGRQREDS